MKLVLEEQKEEQELAGKLAALRTEFPEATDDEIVEFLQARS